MEWANPISLVLCSFTLIYLLCELGEKVTSCFGVFNVELYRCHWYLFPIEVQRMLVIFMSDTQQPIFIRSYGNIMCTRKVFKKVVIFFY